MRTQQSTMFKPLTVFAILLAIIALAYGQDNNTTTDVTTTDSNGNNSGGLLEGILSNLQSGPLGAVIRPLSLILNPIFAIVNTILSIVLVIPRTILGPVFGILTGVLQPMTGVFGSVTGLVTRMLATVSSLISFILSNVSGILSLVLGPSSSQTGVQRRSRRAIMDSLTGMAGMAWESLTFPFRFVLDIISMIFLLFQFIYSIAMWPYHLFFGNNSDSDISSQYALSTDFSINNMVSSFLLNLSESSQGAIFEMLISGWAAVKNYLLPAVDNLLVSASNSTVVPDDIKSWLSTAHTAYKMLRMFGLV